MNLSVYLRFQAVNVYLIRIASSSMKDMPTELECSSVENMHVQIIHTYTHTQIKACFSERESLPALLNSITIFSESSVFKPCNYSELFIDEKLFGRLIKKC